MAPAAIAEPVNESPLNSYKRTVTPEKLNELTQRYWRRFDKPLAEVDWNDVDAFDVEIIYFVDEYDKCLARRRDAVNSLMAAKMSGSPELIKIRQKNVAVLSKTCTLFENWWPHVLVDPADIRAGDSTVAGCTA